MNKEEKLCCMVDVLETLIVDTDFEEALMIAKKNVRHRQKENASAKIKSENAEN